MNELPKYPRGSQVVLTNHAVEQYRERALGGLGSSENARSVLRSLISSTRATAKPPEWMRYHRDADAWIHTRRVSLPLVFAVNDKWVAKTCLHYDSTKLSDEELVRTGVISQAKARL